MVFFLHPLTPPLPFFLSSRQNSYSLVLIKSSSLTFCLKGSRALRAHTIQEVTASQLLFQYLGVIGVVLTPLTPKTPEPFRKFFICTPQAYRLAPLREGRVVYMPKPFDLHLSGEGMHLSGERRVASQIFYESA